MNQGGEEGSVVTCHSSLFSDKKAIWTTVPPSHAQWGEVILCTENRLLLGRGDWKTQVNIHSGSLSSWKCLQSWGGGQVLGPLKPVHRPLVNNRSPKEISVYSDHCGCECPGNGISAGCDVERLLIAGHANSTNLCRKGNHIEDVLICLSGIDWWWKPRLRENTGGWVMRLLGRSPSIESPLGSDHPKTDIQHSQDLKGK